MARRGASKPLIRLADWIRFLRRNKRAKRIVARLQIAQTKGRTKVRQSDRRRFEFPGKDRREGTGTAFYRDLAPKGLGKGETLRNRTPEVHRAF